MAVLIFSGGLDSTTLLYYMAKVEKVDKIHALTFNYGQRHAKEIDHARRIVEFARDEIDLEHRIVDLSSIKDLIAVGALTGDEEVPKAHYADESQRVTVVPNRNMIMLSIAVGYAVKVGAKAVYYSAHRGDYENYPDCRKEFVKAMDTAVYLANIFNPVEVRAPFIDIDKVGIVSIGLKLGVPYHLTWSCYEGGERPCLSCGACIERTEAFFLNKVRDPALSEEEWKKAVEIYRRVCMRR